jgi:ATP-dependent Clp protease ATP-binding subunit ClpA
MPVHEIDLAILLQHLDEDLFLAEALMFPEVSRYGDNPEKLKKAIISNAVRIIETEALPKVWARLKPANFESLEINVTLDPPPKRLTWREPIDLRLEVLRWTQGEAAHIALIPALGIEVLSTKLTDLQPNQDQTSMLQRHARAELQRHGALVNLLSLLLLNRSRALTVAPASLKADIRTPRQVMASAGQKKEKKSTLQQTAVDLTTQKLNPAFEVDQLVENLAEALVGPAAASVLLVGKAGVGKTAVVHELVRRRERFGLGATPFWSTSGARLVAGMTGYGMWQERCDALWQEAEKTNAIVHFGNLVELVDTGKSEHNMQGLASFFRQRFARRQALAILECTPEQLSVVENEEPGTLKVFRQLFVDEPSPEAGRKILKRFADEFRDESAFTTRKRKRRPAVQSKRTQLTAGALDVLDRLHRRFAGYSAYPSRPLRFLRGLLQGHARSELDQIGTSEVIAAFAAETGLPLFLLDDNVVFDTTNTAQWFEERVIGQSAAVSLIVELLATVKAGLTRPRRPIASLLFAGPTGVGKTEMAKSLARFFFGDETRMARFDMSEYADALAVTHLVGGVTGNEGALTARIREQPFSVVLFDEFEKAHHSFFDLLLQTLGDGRMTDGRGRVADFTNSIVVMTSNLGAAKFRRPRAGFEGAGEDRDQSLSDSDRAAQRHFTRAVRDFLRPEIFNRIDHIVSFTPLDRKTVERIAARELKLVEQRDGLRRRGVALHTSPAALEVLARRGYDAQYGARPLKRLIERELLLPLSVELNSRPAMAAGKRTTMIAEVDVNGGRLAVELSEERKFHESLSLAARVDHLGELRRRIVKLGRSSAVIELQNTIWRLSELERRIRKAARRAKLNAKLVQGRFAVLNPAESAILALLPAYRQTMATLSELESKSANAEDEALLMFYSGEGPRSTLEQDRVIKEIEAGLQDLLRELLDLRCARPRLVTIALYSENKDALFELAQAYYSAAVGAQMRVTASHYTASLPAGYEADEVKVIEMLGRMVMREGISKPPEFLQNKPGACTAIVFSLEGTSAYATWMSEHGLHTFVAGKTNDHVFVHPSDVNANEYRPPLFLEKRGAINPTNAGARRRTYQRTESYIEDHLLAIRRDWRGGLPTLLAFFMDQQRQRAAERLIEE